MKKGIRYLRFSSDGQSLHSIERQDLITGQWMNNSGVEIVDTFIDEGHTARNFDRPDIKVLFDFIKKNHDQIDYLVVAELTRFSRIAGDAINMVTKIQALYDVRIVSASRGSIYDCMDHNSFFIMGLEFLMGNSENIKRQNDINAGIYTAKAVKGLWIQGGRAPFGYKKEGKNEARRLVVDESEAIVVRYIYDAYIAGVALYKIKEKAIEMGLKRTATTAVERILTNPLYYGFQHVKAWKQNPGGLFPLKNHEPIIEATTWKLVNEKIKRGNKERKIYDDLIPLRGALRCHCGKLLTGAASKGKMGKYYYYYKCSIASAHNNISAKKAHKQLSGALELMSLPEKLISSIKEKSEIEMEITLKEHKTLLKQRQIEYEQVGEKLMSIEEKWITNRIQHDTYERWHNELTIKKESLKEQIDKLRHNGDKTFLLLRDQLFYLSDLNYVYTEANTIEKQELIKMVFDDFLYYENGIYRTPYIMEPFIRNELKMREMGYLDYTKKRGNFSIIPSSGAGEIRTLVQSWYCIRFLHV